MRFHVRVGECVGYMELDNCMSASTPGSYCRTLMRILSESLVPASEMTAAGTCW